jgi:hypothetical protein
MADLPTQASNAVREALDLMHNALEVIEDIRS